MQKLCAKLPKGGPHSTSKPGGPETTTPFAFPDILP